MNTEDNGQLNFAASIDYEKLRSDAAESRNILHSIGQQAATESAAIDAAFAKIGATVGGIFTLAQAASFAKKIVDVRGEIESLSISFETLLGSKAKADDLFSSIRKFAVETPMQLNDLAKAAQTMLSFNIDDGKIMTYLKALGDISMGDSQKFNSLTLAFSQMSATGKLMGQDLLQMINAGFNPLATISEQTGKSIAALKKEMEGGAISAQMVQNAFVAAASEGGKFNNMLLSQSKSINGAISNLQGAFDDMLNEIGTKSQGIISGTIDTATTMVKNYQDVAEAITAVIAVCGSYKAAIAVNEAVTRLCAQAHEEQAAAFIAEYEAQMATVNAKPAEISAGQASMEVTLKEAIAKGQLTEAEAAHVLAVYQETEAEVNALKTAAAAAETRLAEAAATEEAAAAHVKAAEEKYIAAFKAGDATAREAAASEVAAAKDELAAASKAKLTASTEANTASTKANAAALALESTKVEITTTKTTVLTAAKNALTAATKRLYATIAAHPYALVLAAVVALAYGIYKVATYQSDWQKAQEKLNDATKECNKSIASERVQADQLFAKLRAAKTGTEAYAKAKTDILNKYGKYLSGLNEEIKTLQDVEGAYKAVTRAAKEAAQARAMEKFKTDAADTYASVEADQREAIYKLMQKKFRGQKNTSGGSYAEDMFAQVIAAIENGSSIDEGLLRKFDKKNFIIDTEGGNSYEYITNDLQDILNKINAAKDTYNKTMQEAERRFGKAASEEGGGETTQEETKDKEYWDKKKKEAQKELEALTVEEANAQKGLEIKKRISEIQKKIDSYSTSKGESAGKKTNQQQAEADKRLQEIEAAKKAQEKATAAAALELEQQQLDLDEDSTTKQLKQIGINSRRMQAALEDRRDALLEVYRDILEKEWQNANPNAKDKGMIFDRSSVTRELMQEDMGLPGNEYLKKEWASIEESGKIISDIIAKQTQDALASEREALNNFLVEYGTYEQKKQALIEQYKAEITKAGTEGDRRTIQKQFDEAFSNLDLEHFKKQINFDGLFDNLAELTDKELVRLQKQLESFQADSRFQLMTDEDKQTIIDASNAIKTQLSSSGGIFKNLTTAVSAYKTALEELSTAQQKYNDALASGIEEAIENAKKNLNNAQDNVVNKRTNLKDSNSDTLRSITSLSNAVSGLGDTSDLSLEKLGNLTVAVADTFTGFGEQVQDWASAIVAVGKLFSSEEEGGLIKSNGEKLAEEISELERSNRSLENVISRLSDKLSESSLAEAKSVYEEQIKYLQKEIDNTSKMMQDAGANYSDGILGIGGKHSTNYKLDKVMTVSDWQRISTIVGQSVTSASEFFALSADQMTLVADNATDLWLKIYEHAFDGYSDASQYMEQYIAYQKELEELQDEYNEKLTNVSFDSLKDDFRETLLDMDASAEDFADNFSEMLRSAVIEGMMTNKYDQLLENWYNDFASAMEDGALDETEKKNLQNEYNNIVTEAYEERNALFEALNLKDSSRSGVSSGIATASQDSVDELNGRATAIQSHTYSISENTKLLVENTQELLRSVMHIESETDGFGARLERMETTLSGVRTTLEDMNTRGIKIKN